MCTDIILFQINYNYYMLHFNIYSYILYLFSVIFKELINMCDPKSKEQLFIMHGEKLLKELCDNCDSWLVHSPGREVFDKIATDAGN